MGWLRLGLAAVLTMALSACAITSVDRLDTGAIPTGPIQPLGEEATGEIVRLGQGRTLGIGWRYAIYESALGWCSQLEMAGVASTGCGGPVPAQGATFGSVSHGGAAGAPSSVDGVVAPGVAEVWITSSDGERFPSVLMPLAQAGLAGNAFLAFLPAGAIAASVEALDAEGEIVDVYDLN